MPEERRPIAVEVACALPTAKDHIDHSSVLPGEVMHGKILITGGTGFIGKAAASALAQAGYLVQAGSRRDPVSSEDDVQRVLCDLNCRAQIDQVVADASLVVHCAFGEDALMVRQCSALLDAMAAAGVSRLIFLSSIAVYGDANAPNAPKPVDPGHLSGAYARGKAHCEQLIREWAEGDAGRIAIILRPGAVYGKGSHFWIDKLALRIKAGIWGHFGSSAEGTAPLVHVDDVANVVRASVKRLDALRSDQNHVEVFDVVGPETPTWNQYFNQVAIAIGDAPLPEIRPSTLTRWMLAGYLVKAWRKLGLPGGGKFALAPGKGELQLFSRRTFFNMRRTEDALGIKMTIGLKEGLARSFDAQDTKPAPYNRGLNR